MAKLDRLLAQRTEATQALAFDTSGALELTGAPSIPASEVVAIRDVWSVLGRELGAGELREISCTDGKTQSLFIADASGRTLALVEPAATVETLGDVAQDVVALLRGFAEDQRG
jgi:hypothetical protein